MYTKETFGYGPCVKRFLTVVFSPLDLSDHYGLLFQSDQVLSL